ncbi:SH3 domain-containing protein [Paracoccus salsus]|uniref:SH3 domain-containing protein n=1 Tax=Paracoccus salsus TaxID=2911061 RepID=UPI001F2656D7|nr:SH3 domain-containing protein [Paracoccus salsus]MCF3973628.1 SH3 domain-containing protein [Paracoccus salsus]
MIRLFVLMAVTLAALYAVMSVYGAGNPRAELRQAQPAPSRSAARDAGSRSVLSAPDPAPLVLEPDDPPPAEMVPASEQTPARVRDFPGPPLRPSPEYRGAASEASAPGPSGATGPILYVTGTRVNFRAGPSTGDRVIGALNGGEAVEALGPPDSDWVNIRDSDGRVGYMSGRFLSDTPPG